MSSNGIHESLLCAHGNESGQMEWIIRGPGLRYFLCMACSWSLLYECPDCYRNQQFYRNSPVLSDLCPIILCDTMAGIHAHCVTVENVVRPYMPSAPRLCTCPHCQSQRGLQGCSAPGGAPHQ
ncbi:hypothetical protein ZHAS_00004485 [Anopheles sinensis]|uniref:Uncharacterized protein n=1 Tax=Anopheles sinensis TaxID=74873 RepID=A0A084VH21_ANOSI|nr:hypothetical protein ZHAS_00004485 [Anopheles sinensis]